MKTYRSITSLATSPAVSSYSLYSNGFVVTTNNKLYNNDIDNNTTSAYNNGHNNHGNNYNSYSHNYRHSNSYSYSHTMLPLQNHTDAEVDYGHVDDLPPEFNENDANVDDDELSVQNTRL